MSSEALWPVQLKDNKETVHEMVKPTATTWTNFAKEGKKRHWWVVTKDLKAALKWADSLEKKGAFKTRNTGEMCVRNYQDQELIIWTRKIKSHREPASLIEFSSIPMKINFTPYKTQYYKEGSVHNLIVIISDTDWDSMSYTLGEFSHFEARFNIIYCDTFQ